MGVVGGNAGRTRFFMGARVNKKAFYNSDAWQRARQAALIRDNYLCVRCLKRHKIVPATIVHHLEHLENVPDKALELQNLQSVCDDCHNKAHPEKGRKNVKPKPAPPGGVRIYKL